MFGWLKKPFNYSKNDRTIELDLKNFSFSEESIKRMKKDMESKIPEYVKMIEDGVKKEDDSVSEQTLLSMAIGLLRSLDISELDSFSIDNNKYDDGSNGFTISFSYPPKETVTDTIISKTGPITREENALRRNKL